VAPSCLSCDVTRSLMQRFPGGLSCPVLFVLSCLTYQPHFLLLILLLLVLLVLLLLLLVLHLLFLQNHTYQHNHITGTYAVFSLFCTSLVHIPLSIACSCTSQLRQPWEPPGGRLSWMTQLLKPAKQFFGRPKNTSSSSASFIIYLTDYRSCLCYCCCSLKYRL
jgi:hypothetical protein